MTKRIALFGGAFDPPHLGHMVHLTVLLESGLVDEIWVVPSGARDDKTASGTAADRQAMIERAIAECFPNRSELRLELCELRGEVPTKGTIGLLDHLRGGSRGDLFYVVIGNELVKDLPRWREAERLRSEAVFLVTGRAGIESTAMPGYTLIGVPNRFELAIELSSTMVRRMVAEGAEIGALVPRAVAGYIGEHGLYRQA